MYAIIKTGGKQYKVAEGDVLNVEKLDARAKAKRFWSSNTEPKLTIANALVIVSRSLL